MNCELKPFTAKDFKENNIGGLEDLKKVRTNVYTYFKGQIEAGKVVDISIINYIDNCFKGAEVTKLVAQARKSYQECERLLSPYPSYLANADGINGAKILELQDYLCSMS